MNSAATSINKIFGGKVRVRVNGICIRDEQILLVKHVNIGEKSYFWNPPGGGLEFGETLERCLQREFLEETGLQIRVGKLLFVNEFLQPPLHAVELNFLVEATGGKLIAGHDPELEKEQQIIREVRFMDIGTVNKLEEGTVNPHLRTCKNREELLKLSGLLIF
ncbi:MAG: NUDIX domain-containing protein [Cytophagales bacterium]|nr:NUDIX domain-containing protein [Cytophagales bacterium]